MKVERLEQTAGSHSQQVQVQGDFVLATISTENANQIANQLARQVAQLLSAEALETANSRITDLNDRAIAKLSEKDALQILADPSFQVLLKKAQIGAAATERDDDYEMLADLLADRALRGDERHVRAGISRAVEVVDALDYKSLLGLTAFQAIKQYVPVSGMISAGLDAIDGLFEQLVAGGDLPTGQEWLDHLDLLNAVRVDNAEFVEFSAFYPTRMPGYVCTGIESGSAEHLEAMKALTDAGIDSVLEVDHELKPGFKRLRYLSLAELESAAAAVPGWGEEDLVRVREVASRYRLDTVDPDLVPRLMEELYKRDHLRIVANWWEEIKPTHFRVTPVGLVLARANAMRLDTKKMLPPIS